MTRPTEQRDVTTMLLAVALLALTGCGKDAGDQTPSRPPVPVYLGKVRRADIPIRRVAIGTLRANQIATIAPQIAGNLVELHFSDGQRVKKGQVLATLDLQTQQAEVKALKAKYEKADFTYQRTLEAYKKQVATDTELADAKYDRDSAKADLAEATATLEKMTIKAPFSGRLSMHLRDVGDYVQVGEPLVTLVQDDPMLVDYEMSEAYADELAVDQPVHVYDADTGQQRAVGKVIAFDPQINPATHSISVRGQMPNPNHKLFSGRFVEVKQQVRIAKDQLLIPQQALVVTRKGKAVFVVDNGVAKQTPITLGEFMDNKAIVKDGLKAGQTIVVSGWQKLRSGAKVVDVHKVPGVPTVGGTTSQPGSQPATQSATAPAGGSGGK